MIIPAKSQFNWLSGFQQEDLKNFDQSEHIMGPGSHVGFPISAKYKNLVYDHPISLDQICSCGFRKKDENVKFP